MVLKKQILPLSFLIIVFTIQNSTFVVISMTVISGNYLQNLTSGDMFYVTSNINVLRLFYNFFHTHVSSNLCITLLNCQCEQGRASTCGITYYLCGKEEDIFRIQFSVLEYCTVIITDLIC